MASASNSGCSSNQGTSATQNDPLNAEGSERTQVSCQICYLPLDVRRIWGTRHKYIVRCPRCGEWSPIRKAPTGKKYVRCPHCHWLMMVRAASTEIPCSNDLCTKVVHVAATD